MRCVYSINDAVALYSELLQFDGKSNNGIFLEMSDRTLIKYAAYTDEQPICVCVCAISSVSVRTVPFVCLEFQIACEFDWNLTVHRPKCTIQFGI